MKEFCKEGDAHHFAYDSCLDEMRGCGEALTLFVFNRTAGIEGSTLVQNNLAHVM